MKIVFKEYGTYVAKVAFDIDLEELNSDMRANYVTNNIRDITSQDIEDCMAGYDTTYLDTDLHARDNDDDVVLIGDIISDYIYDKQIERINGLDRTFIDFDLDDRTFDSVEET